MLLNGIDPCEFRRDLRIRERVRTQLGCQPGEVVLGAAGRVEQQKRFDVLVEALGILRRSHPQVRLVIAGEGSLRETLARQIRRLTLENRCQLLGYRADVADLYQAFDVLVQSSDYEGTPTVVVEAMALEIPVVATDVGGTVELAHHREHALIVPRRDPSGLARAIAETLDRPLATASRVFAARKRVEAELSFETRTRTLEAIYRELVESRLRHDDE